MVVKIKDRNCNNFEVADENKNKPFDPFTFDIKCSAMNDIHN